MLATVSAPGTIHHDVRLDRLLPQLEALQTFHRAGRKKQATAEGAILVGRCSITEAMLTASKMLFKSIPQPSASTNPRSLQPP